MDGLLDDAYEASLGAGTRLMYNHQLRPRDISEREVRPHFFCWLGASEPVYVGSVKRSILGADLGTSSSRFGCAAVEQHLMLEGPLSWRLLKTGLFPPPILESDLKVSPSFASSTTFAHPPNLSH